MEEKEPKIQPAPKAKKKAKPDPVSTSGEYLINWKAAADSIEAELKDRGWDSAKQRRNPRLVVGLIMRHLVRPLVRAIHERG